MSIYCVKCRKKTEDGPLEAHVTKNGKPMVKSKCQVCGTMTHKFVSSKEIQGGSLGTMFKALMPMIKTALPKIAKTVLPTLGLAAASGAISGATSKAVRGEGLQLPGTEKRGGWFKGWNKVW